MTRLSGTALPRPAGYLEPERQTLNIEPLNPVGLPAPSGNYTHGTRVQGASELVFVSGQVHWGDDAVPLPASFDDQCRTVWRNVLRVLHEAGLGPEHLVKVTTYLASRDDREANSRIREEVLGENTPALTIIICDIYAEEWLLEIDAIAARD